MIITPNNLRSSIIRNLYEYLLESNFQTYFNFRIQVEIFYKHQSTIINIYPRINIYYSSHTKQNLLLYHPATYSPVPLIFSGKDYTFQELYKMWRYDIKMFMRHFGRVYWQDMEYIDIKEVLKISNFDVKIKPQILQRYLKKASPHSFSELIILYYSCLKGIPLIFSDYAHRQYKMVKDYMYSYIILLLCLKRRQIACVKWIRIVICEEILNIF